MAASSPAAASPLWSDMGSTVKLRGAQQRGLLARLGSQRFILQARNTPESKVAVPGAKLVLPGVSLRRYEKFTQGGDSVTD